MLRLEGVPISAGFASGIAVVYDYEVGRRLEVSGMREPSNRWTRGRSR